MNFPKSLSEIWPNGPEEFKRDLLSHGFIAEFNDETIDWKKLRRPVSIEAIQSKNRDPSELYAYSNSERHFASLANLSLGLLIADSKLKNQWKGRAPVLWTNFPDAALDLVLRKAFPQEWSGTSSSPKFSDVLIEENVVIGPGSEIGPGTILETGVRIGARVRIGRNCRIGAHTRIADDCVLGDQCQLAGFVAIGGQGFGTISYPSSPNIKVLRHHVGRVSIGNRVRMGAYVSVDRGVLDDTVIDDDCLFDNHVQVGHNCVIGKNSIFCSFVGLSGSTHVGDSTVFAGMVGTGGHVSIGSRVVVAAQSGISKDVPDDCQVKGYPPRPLAEALKIQTIVGKLPEIYERLKKLEKSEDLK